MIVEIHRANRRVYLKGDDPAHSTLTVSEQYFSFYNAKRAAFDMFGDSGFAIIEVGKDGGRKTLVQGTK